MDSERCLISKVLSSRDIRPVIDAQVRPQFFEDEDHRRAYQWMLGFWAEYHETPTVRAFKKNFPNYRLVKVPEPLQWYVDEMLKRRKYGLTVETLQAASSALDNGSRDTESALATLHDGLRQINTEITAMRDTNLSETWKDRYEGYKALKDLPNGLRGISTGFPSLDAALSGLQKQQLITLVGLPKSGKSLILLRIAANTNETHKPLYVGFEMSNDEQEARHDAMIAQVSYPKLVQGKLSLSELKQLRLAMRERSKRPPFILSADISSTTTVSGIAAKVEQHEPDIVFVDGVYMMDDEEGEATGSPQAITNVTRGLKRMAQKLDLPVVITTQVLPSKMRRRWVTMDSIGYSSSFAQDSDVILAVEDIKTDEGEAKDKHRISIIGARAAPISSLTIRWDWRHSIFEEIENEEVEDQEDDEGF